MFPGPIPSSDGGWKVLTIKVRPATQRLVRWLAATTDERIYLLFERLVMEEAKRVAPSRDMNEEGSEPS